MLWNRSLVIIDLETKSLWSHLLGEAMSGTLRGTKLKPLISELVTWEAWKREHPQTTVLNLPRTHRDYDKDFYRRPGDFVFAFVEDGQPHAVPFDVLQKDSLLNLTLGKSALLVTFDGESTAAHLFSRTLNGRTLKFIDEAGGRMHDRETGSVWNRNTGIALDGPLKGKSLDQQVGIVSYAQAWKVFHPESRTVRPGDGNVP